MAKKEWHKNFISYMNFIINHENYKGLEINKKNDGSYSWIAPKISPTGKSRIEWAKNKAKDLNIPLDSESFFAKVMFEIHPIKEKTCQICGENMYITYVYPNAILSKSIEEEFKITFSVFDTIYDICDQLISIGIEEEIIKNFFIKKLKLNNVSSKISINEILDLSEIKCRKGLSNQLSPGAMSNFPDRFDGFHTYNRCCRKQQDKGRHDDNMKTYNKDRRAYENWSDGNIHAANKFMRSEYFKGVSADHIGPISLGFIHDSRFLQPMPSGENSSKRDKITYSDFLKLVELEKKFSCSPVSWFAKIIWEDMKLNINENLLDYYRDLLKQNITNFMTLLSIILTDSETYNSKYGLEFLKHFYIKPKLNYFKYDYTFKSDGTYTVKNRKITDATKKEEERFFRISIESVNDFSEKNNRNIKSTNFRLIEKDISLLLQEIKINPKNPKNKKLFEMIMAKLQVYLINNNKKAEI